MTTQNMSPDAEHKYLMSYAVLTLNVGVLLMLAGLGDLSKDLSAQAGIPVGTAILVAAIIWIIFSSLQLKKYPDALKSEFLFSKQSVMSRFDDEFLNLINLRAYKVAFFTFMVPSIPGLFGFYEYLDVSSTPLLMLLMGAVFVGYGITVRKNLSDDDE